MQQSPTAYNPYLQMTPMMLKPLESNMSNITTPTTTTSPSLPDDYQDNDVEQGVDQSAKSPEEQDVDAKQVSDISSSSSPPAGSLTNYPFNVAGYNAAEQFYQHYQAQYHQASANYYYPPHFDYQQNQHLSGYYSALANTTSSPENNRYSANSSASTSINNSSSSNLSAKNDQEDVKLTPPPLTPPSSNNTSSQSLTNSALYYNSHGVNLTSQQVSPPYQNYYPTDIAAAAHRLPNHQLMLAAAAALNKTAESSSSSMSHPLLPPSHAYYEAPQVSPSPLPFKEDPKIQVNLCDSSLWDEFHKRGTEMIITKNGRRMFPAIKIEMRGLQANKIYSLQVQINPVDDNRYKYTNMQWQVGGKAEHHDLQRSFYVHPDGPMSGHQWMKSPISFHKMKLTNNPFDKNNHVVLNSMHKYVPRVIVYEFEKKDSVYPKLIAQIHEIKEAEFMAVTAYQNNSITEMKIQHNPFAKGFRDGQNKK